MTELLIVVGFIAVVPVAAAIGAIVRKKRGIEDIPLRHPIDYRRPIQQTHDATQRIIVLNTAVQVSNLNNGR